MNNQSNIKNFTEDNNSLLRKRILVTACSGFIGSHVCEYLLNQGNKVICLDNLFTGKKDNIKHMKNNINFEFMYHDVVYPIDINKHIDEIYNLSCPAAPPKYQIDPIYTSKTNFLGTLNLLELARQNKCKFLLSSTSEIYGEPTVSPQNESYRGNVNTIGIRSCYDEGKRIAETLTMDYHKKFNIDTKIVRIFNTNGPNMDKNDGRVISNFIMQMLNNEEVTVYGTGKQTRSFCYIDDLITGIVKLMNSNYNKPVNIGNPHEINLLTLLNTLSKYIILQPNQIKYCPLPKDDPTNRKPDITLAKQLLDWEPKVSLEEGLMKTIEYLKNN